MVKERVAWNQLQEPGSHVAPEPPVLPMGMHAAVVGPTRVYLSWYQHYVKDARNVVRTARRAVMVQEKMSAGDPGVAAYQGKRVIPVFMAWPCASPEVDEEVQEMCNWLGVVRYRTSSDVFRPKP